MSHVMYLHVTCHVFTSTISQLVMSLEYLQYFCVRSFTNAQENFKLVSQPLFLHLFHAFSVNSQNTSLSADFLQYTNLFLIQTCSRTIVYLK